jgi:DtxR family Mn-dependent transcriptional regulator
MMEIRTPSPTIEDYLGIIYTLFRDGEEIYGARLAELLNVSAPTVTLTLRRMVRDGWITINTAKRVQLTPRGIQAAHAVIRRHMLTEWMLAKILDIPWSEIHEEAHRLEHSISSDVEKSLSAALQAPTQCPHGNPMPGSEKVSDQWLPLDKCQENDFVVIRRIHEFLEDDQELLRFLEGNQIMPGNTARISANRSSSNNIVLIIEGQNVSLDMETANHIFVEII